MAKAVAYAEDRSAFGRVAQWTEVLGTLGFVCAGGLGLVEGVAERLSLAWGAGRLGVGLGFFTILGFLSGAVSLPFDLYATFVIEERHGFNRQTLRGFLADRSKGLAVAAILGGVLVGALLLVMERTGERWWLWAWLAVTGFSLLAAWIYPTVLAPLFNTFTPLPDGDLRERILALAAKVGFRAGGIFVMDASRRTSHGNAYFTGLLGARRIVLFDTLVGGLSPAEVVSVLAHELGHFKLHHVRWALVRGTLVTGALLFAMSRLASVGAFYAAFDLAGPSAYGALAVFGLWFGPAGFLLQPLETALSRRHEFAADAFAVAHLGTGDDLAAALLKLRERSKGLPLVHPAFSRVYYSHPPLLERLRALRSVAQA